MFLHLSDRSAQLDAERGGGVARFPVKTKSHFFNADEPNNVDVACKQTLVFTADPSTWNEYAMNAGMAIDVQVARWKRRSLRSKEKGPPLDEKRACVG